MIRIVWLTPELKPWMETYFSPAYLERVQSTANRISKILNEWWYRNQICELVTKMEKLDFESITKLITDIALYMMWWEESLSLYQEYSLEKQREIQEDIQLLSVALLDIFILICCWKYFNIKSGVLMGIIALNMKFSWWKSWWISNENIATHVIEAILHNPEIDKQGLIEELREKSSLDENKFIAFLIQGRKKWASCPLYAYKDSNDFIRMLWELMSITHIVVWLKFNNPKTLEECFLTGKNPWTTTYTSSSQVESSFRR